MTEFSKPNRLHGRLNRETWGAAFRCASKSMLLLGGFDRVFNLLNNAQRLHAVDSWPPYDIVKLSDNDYSITMAVAGYGQGDLDIAQERNVLVIKGGRKDKQEGEFLHRGISPQSFERRFELRTMSASRRRRWSTVFCG
jgi:HSP20 family molecular chaperone IbpA